VLLLALRFALIWAGIFLGLAARDPQAVVAVQVLVWPIGFLSSVFVAPSTMPGWLGTIAEWNPISSTATAVRELFGNPGFAGGSWVADHALLMAVAWPVALTLVFAPLAARRYRGLGA
jgi:ABC-type multidrug transport system permease subunit